VAEGLHLVLDVIGTDEGTVFPETAIDTTGSIEFVGMLIVDRDSPGTREEAAAMCNPVVHFEIIDEDQRLLNDFYGSVFDWKIGPAIDGYATVSTGSGIAIGIGAKVEARRHVIFYVEVADIHAALALIEGMGGKLGFGPRALPPGPSSAASLTLKVT
jgi:predicted enzyme related to lactoylglutathione lyase